MFSKKSAEPEPRASHVARASGASGSFSVIGSDVTITGNVVASTELHVDGSVEGDIECASLVQGETSKVTGAIRAETARIAGTVEGSIDARELVVLRTASIKGDVHYDALTIEQGANVDGRFAPRSNGKPASVASVSPATDTDIDSLPLSAAN